MNKEKIGKKLYEYVKLINERFWVSYDDDLVLVCGIIRIVWFNKFDKYKLKIQTDCLHEDDYSLIAKTGIINKFYLKAIELLNQYDNKYTVQITRDEDSYLYVNSNKDYKHFYFDNIVNSYSGVNEFTQAQIEEFKKNDDLAIDWNKAIIKEVK